RAIAHRTGETDLARRGSGPFHATAQPGSGAQRLRAAQVLTEGIATRRQSEHDSGGADEGESPGNTGAQAYARGLEPEGANAGRSRPRLRALPRSAQPGRRLAEKVVGRPGP